LQAYRQASAFTTQPNHTYSLPVDWFSLNADNLLLNLRCLEPSTIPLPASSVTPAATKQVQQKLAEVRPQAQATAHSLGQLLAWEEVVTVLAHPEWLNASTPTLEQATPEVQPEADVSGSTSVMDNILNVATWFQGQLDEFAQQLAWVLLPPTLQPAALRSATAEWDLLLDNLIQNGLSIPGTAARAYRDFEWAGNTLRLHVITWELDSVEPEWVLLLVLGGQPHTRLAIGSRLQVRDDSQVLVQQELTDSDRMYLYAQVVGNQDEQFWVSIGSNKSMLSLPPFAFRPPSARP
jgi:hypothetical protein